MQERKQEVWDKIPSAHTHTRVRLHKHGLESKQGVCAFQNVNTNVQACHTPSHLNNKREARGIDSTKVKFSCCKQTVAACEVSDRGREEPETGAGGGGHLRKGEK